MVVLKADNFYANTTNPTDHNQAACPTLFYPCNPFAPSSANQSSFQFGSSPFSTNTTTTVSDLFETNSNATPFRFQPTPAPSSASTNANANHFPFTTASSSSNLFSVTNPKPVSFPASAHSRSSNLSGVTNPITGSFPGTTPPLCSGFLGNANHTPESLPATTVSSSSSIKTSFPGVTNPIPASVSATTISPLSSLFGATNPIPASFSATTVSSSSNLFVPESFPATTAPPCSPCFGVTNHTSESLPATTVTPTSSLFGATNPTPESFPANFTRVSGQSSFSGLTNHTPESFPATTVLPSNRLFGVTNPTPASFPGTTTSPSSSWFTKFQSEPFSSSIFASSNGNATTTTQTSSSTPLFSSPAPKFGDGFLRYSNSANAFSAARCAPCASSTIFGEQTTMPPLHVCPCCGHKSSWEQHFGSFLAQYSRTPETGSSAYDTDFFVSISAAPVYKDKSHEELRFEDYILQGKAKSGQQKSVTQEAESAKFGQQLWGLPVLLVPVMPFFNFSGFAATPAGGSLPASGFGPTAPFMNALASGQSSFIPASSLPIIPGVLPLHEMLRRL